MGEAPDRNNTSQDYWEEILSKEKMPAKLTRENRHLKRQRLGDGLGNKPGNQDRLEDTDKYHSDMCPLVLNPDNTDPNYHIDIPSERPTEAAVIGEDD